MHINKDENLTTSLHDYFAYMTSLSNLHNGETNNIHPIAAAAAAAKSNIFNHREAMKAHDVDDFLKAMEE